MPVSFSLRKALRMIFSILIVPLHSLQVPEVCDLSASSGQGFPQLSSTPELCDKDTSEELGSPKLSI